MIKYTWGEVLDRLTIELRKNLYGAKNEDVLESLKKEVPAFVLIAAELGVYNSEIASLEWAIREARELTVEEIGKRALAIRALNGCRVAAKNKLSAFMDQPISEGFVGKGSITADEWSKHFQEPKATREISSIGQHRAQVD